MKSPIVDGRTQPIACTLDASRFEQLAHRGQFKGASGGETRAARIMQVLLDDLAGLDDRAINGLVDLVIAMKHGYKPSL